MKKISAYTVFLFIFFSVIATSSIAQEFSSAENVFQAYRKQKDIGTISSIVVPTVVEIPLEEEYLYDTREFGLYDVSEGIFEPNIYHAELIPNQIMFTISSEEQNRLIHFPERMIDKNSTSYADLLLPPQGQGTARLVVQASRPITSSGITLSLENNVALPTSIEIQAVVNGDTRVVLRKSAMTQTTVRFPQVTSSQWTITFSYAQPLRITELSILNDKAPAVKQGVRFLAQPNHAYRLYLDPDNLLRPRMAQSANLSLNEGVVRLPAISSKANPLYRPADTDEDGVPNITDNCVSLSNPDQIDIDGNGRGDACDDFDRDGLLNSRDNCPDNPNNDQRDTDGDLIGDVCDKEESRFTEQYPWIPWVGIGSAGAVLIVLLFLATRSFSSIPTPGDDPTNPII